MLALPGPGWQRSSRRGALDDADRVGIGAGRRLE
jgi:hypothetical protein